MANGRVPVGCDHRHMGRTVIQGCHIATCDGVGTEYVSGHVVIEHGRITATGAGSAPPAAGATDTETIDGSGCLLTPGLINTHHHLYQWATRGVSQDETLFGWLTTLYPIWANIDE